MPTDPSQLAHLLQTPGETLNVELKRWIDPSTPEGMAKIVKGCLALRNRNGGYLVIGVDDKTLAPLPCPAALDAALFASEAMQDLVSRYASEPFPVEVALVASPAAVHPVIAVPNGVRAPVAVKRRLAGPAGELLREGEVPFRTLNANGRVSSAAARPQDWRDLVDICFDNREADVARFLRRHLSAITPETLRTVIDAASTQPGPTLTEEATVFLDTCGKRFSTVAATVDVRVKPDWGGWEVGLVIDPPVADAVADRAFLDRVYAANPNYGGWPIWLDLRGMQELSPRVKDDGWEALAAFDSVFDILDFYRFEPQGRFYSRRPHFDDAAASARGAQPRLILDPVSVLADVGETLAVALAISRAVGVREEGELGFAWRWSGLQGRRLATFSPMELGAMLVSQHTSESGEVREVTTMPAATSPLSVAPYARAATRRLFAAFNGFSVREENVEGIVAARLSRRNP